MTNINNSLVFLSNKGNPITSSRNVADKFGKLHKNVLQALENIECSADFRRLNFQPSQYEQIMPTGGVKNVTEIIMTQDGFTFLAMGFTGALAASFKEEYIAAFNAMRQELRPKPQNRMELISAALLEATLVLAERDNAIAELAPKAEFYDVAMSSQEGHLIRDVSKMLAERGKVIGEKKLFALLREKSIFMKDNTPYQDYVNRGYFRLKLGGYTDIKTGEHHTTVTPMVLPKGVDYIHKIMSVPVSQNF